MKKIKFQAFGKVTFKNYRDIDKTLIKLNEEKAKIENESKNEGRLKQIETEMANKILEKQKKNLNKEIDNLKLHENKKGKTATIFKIKKNIVGDEHEGNNSVSMKHFRTKEQLFNNEEINEAALEYCIELLSNREPKDNYKKNIEFLNKIHEVRMNEKIENDDELTIKMLNESL